MNDHVAPLCERLAAVRRKHFGERGKARFARELGIGATTYQHYEIDRVPPVDLLIRVAELTGTSLDWLLRGDGSIDQSSAGTVPTHPVVARVKELVDRRPDLVQGVSGFLDILDGVASKLPKTRFTRAPQSTESSRLIPVVGSTAAGPARFWKNVGMPGGASVDINEHMEQLLAQHDARVSSVGEVAVSGVEVSEMASLVQLSRPDDLGFVEFLDCSALKLRHPRAIAWRIDGDSMSPRYDDGDLVVVSPDQSAVEGYPCVAHQVGQIGANCKIYNRSGDEVVLIPLKESSQPQRIQAHEIVWAYRVLFSVRFRGRG